MNIKELKSNLIKKNLKADSVCFRWHNKNLNGGNFGINICGVQEKDYEITGYYNIKGTITDLYFGYLFRGHKLQICADEVEKMISEIQVLIKQGEA